LNGFDLVHTRIVNNLTVNHAVKPLAQLVYARG